MIAIVFPGQGSQRPEMGRELFESRAEAQAVFERVSAAVGQDVASLLFTSDEETLRQTQNAQIALFTCGVAAWHVLAAEGVTPGAMAGHSVGEYAALAAAEVLTVEEGARLVRTRGQLMARAGQAHPGTMAAIIGLDRDAAEAACREAEGAVVVANDNSPGQLVISGDVEAVGRAGALAKEKGAKRVLPLNVSGAFHSPLMLEPAREMGEALRAATFAAPKVPVYSNVTSEPAVDGWAELLERQLSSPVRWTESVQHMRRDGVVTFIECGAGEVLGGLIRRIDKEAKSLAVQDAASLEATLAALKG
ncbi:MAG: ACP S-malonyltransferase [Fimbriimonas sp.]